MKKADPLSQTKKLDPLGLRFDEATTKRLMKCAEKIGKTKTALGQDAVLALIEAIERADYRLVLPLELAPTYIPTANPEVARPLSFTGERRDRKDVSLGYPEHLDVPQHGQISAGRPGAHTAPEPTGTVDIPAGVARVADFAVEVSGDSMEPLIHGGEIAVFRKAEQAGNGQIVAALVDGEMMLKKFSQKNGGPARLESLNKKYPPIELTTSTRIQGVFEGKFSLH